MTDKQNTAGNHGMYEPRGGEIGYKREVAITADGDKTATFGGSDAGGTRRRELAATQWVRLSSRSRSQREWRRRGADRTWLAYNWDCTNVF